MAGRQAGREEGSCPGLFPGKSAEGVDVLRVIVCPRHVEREELCPAGGTIVSRLSEARRRLGQGELPRQGREVCHMRRGGVPARNRYVLWLQLRACSLKTEKRREQNTGMRGLGRRRARSKRLSGKLALGPAGGSFCVFGGGLGWRGSPVFSISYGYG